MVHTMSFINKVVIITGAASGIGEAIALHFAELSARLSLIDINADKLLQVAEQCKRLTKAEVLNAPVDITKDDELKQAVDNTVKEFGKIDVVVNCAGVMDEKGILDSDVIDIFDRVMNVNLRAMVTMTHFAAPALIESKGCVVNIASAVAKMVSHGAFSYNVSKTAVVQFTKNVALELADKGVRVNSVSPGPVKTNILLNSGKTREVNDRMWLGMGKLTPLQRIVSPKEIADMVAYLASDKAKGVTGADFVVDSGLALSGLPSPIKNLLHAK